MSDPRAEISGILVMVRRSSATSRGTTYWFLYFCLSQVIPGIQRHLPFFAQHILTKHLCPIEVTVSTQIFLQDVFTNKKEQKMKGKKTFWKDGFVNKKEQKINTKSEENHDCVFSYFMWCSSYLRKMTHARFKNPKHSSNCYWISSL